MQRGSLISIVLVLGVVFATYAPSLDNGFAMDDRMVAMGMLDSGLPNRMVHELRPVGDYLESHYWAGVQPGGRLYRPLTIFGFALRHHYCGDDPVVAHAINVGLHVLATLLVFWLLACFVKHAGAVAIGAAVFGLHAVHSEVVSTVVGRSELLGFVFGTLALFFWQTTWRWRVLRVPGLVLANAAFFLAFCAKESALAWVPFAFVFAVGRHWHTAERSMQWRELRSVLLQVLAAAAAPVAVFLWLRAGALEGQVAQPVAHLVNQVAHLPALERWPTAVYVLGQAMVLTALPFSLAADYSTYVYPTLDDFLDLRCATVLALVLVLWGRVIFARVRQPALFVAAAAFFGFTFMTSNIPLPIGTIFGERLLYTASLALSFVVAAAAQGASGLPRAGVVMFAAGAWLAANCMVLHERHGVWKDDATLFLHEVENQPKSVRMHTTAAQVQTERGARDLAMDHLQRARRLDPENALVWNNIAAHELESGRLAAAEAAARAGLKAKHVAGSEDLYKLHCNLALILIRQQKPAAAIPHLRQTLEHRPGFLRAFTELQGLVVGSAMQPDALGKMLDGLDESHPDAAPFWALYRSLHAIGGGDASAATGLAAQVEALPAFESRVQWNELLGGRLLALRAPTAALAHFQAALQELPSRVSAFHSLVQLTPGAWTVEAMSAFVEARRKDAPDEPAWELYLLLLEFHAASLGNDTDALGKVRQRLDGVLPRLSRWRDHGRLRGEALSQLARLTERLGKVDAAQAYWKRIADDRAFSDALRRTARAALR